MSSRKRTVVGKSVSAKTLPITFLNDFLVKSSLIYPDSFGTIWLNKILPTVVSVSLVVISPSSLIGNLHLTFAFKETCPSA